MMKILFIVFVCLIFLFNSCERAKDPSQKHLKSTTKSSNSRKYENLVREANQNFNIGDSVTAYLLIDSTYGKPIVYTNKWSNDQEYFTEFKNELFKLDFVITDKTLIYTKEKIKRLDDVIFFGSVIKTSKKGVFYGNELIEPSFKFQLSIVSYGRCFQKYSILN